MLHDRQETPKFQRQQLEKEKPQSQDFLASRKPKDWLWGKDRNILSLPSLDSLPQA